MNTQLRVELSDNSRAQERKEQEDMQTDSFYQSSLSCTLEHYLLRYE